MAKEVISADVPAPKVRHLALFALAIFLSAFLLFLVQPLMGKYILPWFGGSPGVWTTCLLFFQLMLLAGYAYAFFTSTYLSARGQAIVHLLLLVGACAMIPIIPSERWRPIGPGDPTWRILLLLTGTLGIPYFVISSTGPLLQAWFSRLNGGASPYRLYALSNAGSLLALLSYPVVFEPLLRRQQQAWYWSGGLIAFAAVCGMCAWRVWGEKGVGFWTEGSGTNRPNREPQTLALTSETRNSSAWLLWLLLPACASMLLLAATNKICQDIAVIPFLWIIPLSLYLLSFILCFDHPRWYHRAVLPPLWVLALGGATLMLYKQKADTSILLQVAVYSAVMFIGCMVCHGELARLKPHPKHLTHYFLMIAAGGALGGLFVALVAPYVFSNYVELHVALVLVGLLLMAVLWRDPASPLYHTRREWAWILMVAAACMSGYAMWHQTTYYLPDAKLLGRWRNFYGVLTVYEQQQYAEDPDSTLRLLYHGGITHGVQYIDPMKRDQKTTYYGPESGVGKAMELLDEGPRHIGLVGLGTGTLAAYGRRGDKYTFYEINPRVPMIAHSKFTYLDDAIDRGAELEIKLGDARVTLEHQEGQKFDLLVLDAFSGDAIPVHLLTEEAIRLYQRHMKEDGIIAVHVSNQHLELEPVVLRLAKAFKLDYAVIDAAEGGDPAQYASTWVLITRGSRLKDNAELQAASTPTTLDPKAPLWTDEYTSLARLLRWKSEKAKWKTMWRFVKQKVGLRVNKSTDDDE